MTKTIILSAVMCLFTFSAWADDFDKAQLRANVNKAINDCRVHISTIDNKQELLWKPKLGLLDFEKKKKLSEIKKFLPFDKYVDYINDLKLKNAQQKAALEKTINTWTSDLHKLNMKVSEELRAFSSFCIGPVKTIKENLDALEELHNK